MEAFRRLKAKYPTKLILASIMGQNDAEWEELSQLCEENGADAIELNFSCPNMADGGHQAIRLSEDRRPILDGKKCVL